MWRYYYRGEPFGEGNSPSEWTRWPGDLGLWPRVLTKRGKVYRWILVIPGYGPEYPILEAHRV